MLSAKRLYELPLELRIEIGKKNIETYVRMYLLDPEFRIYANSIVAIKWFIDEFVAIKINNGVSYKLGDIVHYVYNNGSEKWYKNDKPHHGDGPAVIHANGYQEYYIDDKLHREDGPAIIYADGYQEYWINGVRH